MKKFPILALACCSFSPLFALSSYYGLEGLNFIPSARSESAFHLAYSSVPSTASDLSLFPYSVRGNFRLPYVEIGITNTYTYFTKNDIMFFQNEDLILPGGGFSLDRTTYVPMIPSFKFAFPDEAVPNGSLAVGVEFPYGLFLCFDYLIPLPDPFGLQVIVGMGTTFATLTSFGGVSVSLPLNLSLALEMGYNGKTDYLTEAQEMFVSAGLAYRLTDAVSADFVFRLDIDGSRRLLCGIDFAL
ncbi:MAG: hypothetical protein A2Z99_03530 [Treponema sp. GWB1_62_6]|nr:MAG: hypothetical protein A2Y36_04520 [Treponema sp. GWA1_62_8]OHE64549.1 MAG: hypothetical protein A2Z99_03530 [Treponema sp. GWB1_62_6]OHE67401.1 MAG: hypothetical protein A2001_07280 [Treponema sp. GWC1_61_84]OHE74710.1 MAG: hypothetical protein A2413_13060 [Treponema sp. RIFOXYC1_FULL_61_9]HCM27495.1 hypothetical protein [Treponema sp.]